MGELIEYGGKLVKVKINGNELLMLPGERLTMIPVTKPKKIGGLYKLWLRFCPEFWRRYKHRRSYLKLLDQWGVTDKETRAYFGSREHIRNERVRVLGLPPIEFNDFDPRKRTRHERQQKLHKDILKAIKIHRTTP